MRTVLWFAKFIIYFFKVRKQEKEYVKKLETGTLTDEDRALINKRVQSWAQDMLVWAGVEWEVTGLENIPKNRSVLFTPNHQGNFDIPLLLSQLPTLCAMVAKKEMQKVPCISGWMSLFNCVFLDRENARAAIASMSQVESILKSGQSVVIFPEGTRSKGDAQNEFKLGSMRPAIRNGIPIVPVAIEGTYKLMEANGGFIKPGKVKVCILEPIETENMTKEESQKLAETVFLKIQEARNVLKIEQ
ncbi:MAG: lysophospholipid acyltransferase family protein [Eubacteriales bacterium]